MPKGNILIVDDNKSVLSALEIMLTPEFDRVQCLSNPNLIVTELRRKPYHLVLLDMNFKAGVNTGNEGIFWLQQIRENHPELSVVLITAYGDVELAVKALKSGATDFILKPWDNTKLLATVRSAIQLSLSREEVKHLRLKEKEMKRVINRDEKYIIGSSPELMHVLKIVRKVAKTDTNILITGENGTGKELIAREIHRLSNRKDEMLVSVDMGAVSESLFESELFGHVKGAFTDARENRAGKFEVANKGSLFLDEIGNLSFHLQAKLLAAIQNREITRIGSNQTIPVDIRLICATNKNLSELVEKGLFREDLLYRINTIHIEIPPLRDRGNDILVLADFFLKRYAYKYDKPALKLNSQAREKLLKYHWPGNIRELEHSIEKAVILSENNMLKADDFFLRPLTGTKGEADTLKLDEMEKRLIVLALEKNPGNVTAAAEQLGITRQTLYNKMKKFGIG
ncbi:sigma-54 dependent transcriptional regulator [uncultured Sunxiuqinia sp.]|uniref:sigma-54-dependent transcriptional regulator n=1 Tax=uncultured Sunxiuqinia sp. TaxID=1573825 RepID=UPI0030DA5C03|tara:strand:- start:18539 stop:19906 length:1368 start_codon:yes stop_codon:yes gene_type:complete